MRKALALLVMIAGVSLMLWAGWQNLRQRRPAAPRANEPVSTSNEPQDAMDTPLAGKPAPGFVLTALDGKKVSLADYKGRPVLVNFWATWCDPCRLEMPWFEQFRKQYADKGFEVLGIATNSGKDDIEKVIRKTGVNYPILLSDATVEKNYGATDAVPMSFYVDRKGMVVAEVAGAGSKDDIEANIQKAIASGDGK
ncbi:MAG: TlpA family protein disulfide reductase [Acidobacteriaceae bacterium]|nr:TlpA family protein disulfide reductase [Acidobacteriaceae bacterium]